MKEDNPIQRLLDTEDNEPIILYDEKDNGVKFEQIALIPYQEELYALLKPVDKMEGVADDEAVVFMFEEDAENGEQFLKVVNDDKIIDEVFAVYLDLIKQEERKDAKAEKKTTKKTEKAPKAEAKPKKSEEKPAKKECTKKSCKDESKK